MAISSFSELRARVFDLYNQRDYLEALAELNRHTSHFPLHQDTVTLWKACLACKTGQLSLARWFLEEGIAAGEWWAPQFLRWDPDLEALRTDEEFIRVVDACSARQAEAERDLMSMRLISEPDVEPPWPVLIALNCGVSQARMWREAVEAGWLLSAPQSTQAAGPDRFAWIDRERSTKELNAHLSQLSTGARSDLSRVVVAGFSSSANFALAVPVDSPIQIRGVVAVAPQLDPADHSLVDRASALATTGAKLVMIAGRRDLYRAEGVDVFLTAFEKAGGTSKAIIEESLSHDFPEDFDQMLPELLAFIERPA